MSKIMTRLAKISEFEAKDRNISDRQNGLRAEADNLQKEIAEWMSTELGLSGNVTLPQILKTVLETSIEPASPSIPSAP
jgi:uncharacterized protein YhaN